MRKVLALALALCLVLCLMPAASAASDSSVCGTYTGKYAYVSGSLYTLDELGMNITIELSNDGKAVLTSDGDDYTGDWEKYANTLDFGTDGVTAAIIGNIISLSYDDVNVTVYLIKDGLSDDEELVAEKQILMSGDWYGWWMITDASDNYSSMVGQWWDLCAEISYGADSTLDIRLWDEDYTRDELEGEIVVQLGANRGDLSVMPVLGGFMGCKIDECEMIYDAEDTQCDDLLVVKDFIVYDGEDSWIMGIMFLRPWGTEWDDIADNPAGIDWFATDMTPYYYDWYTGLLSSGLGMPDKIGDDGTDLDEVPGDKTIDPVSGQVFQGSGLEPGSELTIDATESNSSALIKLKTQEGITVVTFYVEAGTKVTVSVPAEDLYVYFAEGSSWQGINGLFGPDTAYSKDEDLEDFNTYTWSYTLYNVEGGTFEDVPVDEEDF